MNLDNEQRLLNIIEEAEFTQNGLMNKAEMVQVIKDFQVSVRLHPEQQFNQQWTGGNLNNEAQADGDVDYLQEQEVEGEAEGDEDLGEGDEEGESVYMIDGVVMRMIQIEGEDNQYLMDP